MLCFAFFFFLLVVGAHMGDDKGNAKLRIALVCASNMNRSMEVGFAHFGASSSSVLPAVPLRTANDCTGTPDA